MKRTTSQMIRLAMIGDEEIRKDQADAVMGILNERDVGHTCFRAAPILVTQAEAARLLSVSRITIYRMVTEGKLKPVMILGAKGYLLVSRSDPLGVDPLGVA